jgi:hypothetical protein
LAGWLAGWLAATWCPGKLLLLLPGLLENHYGIQQLSRDIDALWFNAFYPRPSRDQYLPRQHDRRSQTL